MNDEALVKSVVQGSALDTLVRMLLEVAASSNGVLEFESLLYS